MAQVRALLLFALVLLALGASTACGDPRPGAASRDTLPGRFDAAYLARLDSLDLALADLMATPEHGEPAPLQRAFRRARAAYKRVEYLLEFEDPVRAAALNGPPIPLVDEDDYGNVIAPRGFQVIEALVYPVPAPDFARVARAEVEEMRRVVGFTRHDSTYRLARTRQVPFRAARMELARVVTLGLAGFDATVSGNGIVESAEALRGLQEGLDVYEASMVQRDRTGWDELQRRLDAGIARLEAAPDFETFDRLGFVVRYASPIARGLARLQRSLALDSNEREPWSAGATDIYAAGAIDPGWFAPDYAPAPTPELVAVGRSLFFDPRLSAGRRRSCATCHRPELAFTDGERIASVDSGHGQVRNTPTLLNAGLQAAQFADQRGPYLEFQFEDVMGNPREMALLPDSAARVLRTDSVLVTRLAAALGRSGTEGLTGRELSLAVAAYVRSLDALDSRFDRAIRGNPAAITESERRGFNLFMGKAACGTCHFAPLFGGTVPPAYQESEAEVIGVPAEAKGVVVDADPGVFAIDSAPLHRHAFKTPTVRNVALTAPYMHNGVFRTLDEVVDFYDAGGGNGLGMQLPNQTLSADSLGLSAGEKRDLVSFMLALTDSSLLAKARPR